MSIKLRLKAAVRNILALLCACLFAISTAKAQNGPVSSLTWSPLLQPVVLGSGLQVTPSQIAVVNQSVTPTSYSWQNKSAYFTMLDYAKQTQTIQNLGINAWAEYQGLAYSVGFSFDYSQYQAFQGNHRHWEVDARQDWTAFVPNPVLNSTAQQYLNNPTTFQGLYGDYAVTGITYRQEIKITFDAEFQSSLTSQQMQAAIQASGACWGAGASVTAAQQELNQFAQVTITATVTGIGQGSGTVIASGTTGDLGTIQSAVQSQLKSWGTAPNDPNDAGNVVSVTLMPYTAIPPIVQITAQPSPDQVKLTSAISEYVYLKNAIARLTQIQIFDTNLNPKLYAYLFGTTNSSGTYIPGRLDVANADLTLEYNYMQALANNNTTVSDPKINFTFDDPDVVRWRVLNATWSQVVGANPGVLFIEIYSNALVTPSDLTATDAALWGTRWFTSSQKAKTSGGVLEIVAAGAELTEETSYSGHLDPVTGIPHRFAYFEWENPPAPNDTTLGLFQNGTQIYTAQDWNGWPAPTLFIPATSFHLP